MAIEMKIVQLRAKHKRDADLTRTARRDALYKWTIHFFGIDVDRVPRMQLGRRTVGANLTMPTDVDRGRLQPACSPTGNA